MSTRPEALGPVLREILHEEAAAMAVDTTIARRRLDDEIERTRHTGRRRVGLVAAAAGVAAAVVAGVTVWNDPATETPAPGPVGQDDPPVTSVTDGPHLLDLPSGERTALPFDPVPADLVPGAYVYFDVNDAGEAVWTTCYSGSCSSLDVMGTAPLDASEPAFRSLPEGKQAYGASWHPDGEILLYQLRGGGQLDVGELVLESDEARRVLDLPIDEAAWWWVAPEFSPAGDEVLFHLPRSAGHATKWDAWTVAAEGGEPRLLQRNATYPQRFPDGERLLVVEPYEGGFAGPRLDVVDPDGTRSTLARDERGIRDPAVSPDGSRVAFVAGDEVHLVDIANSVVETVGPGNTVTWVDDTTLLISPQL
ncbi:TolB family protein [Nocardioides sp. GCM10027113]|uniref:TolB family protein n=1 Tax=unclassified Nocardioides TaxID=2615069 RepID=UPI003621D201